METNQQFIVVLSTITTCVFLFLISSDNDFSLDAQPYDPAAYFEALEAPIKRYAFIEYIYFANYIKMLTLS